MWSLTWVYPNERVFTLYREHDQLPSNRQKHFRMLVSKLIANERFHYIPPQHGKAILPGLWEIGQAIEQHKVMEIEYEKIGGKIVQRTIEPVGLMFSEYYFYLVDLCIFMEQKEV